MTLVVPGITKITLKLTMDIKNVPTKRVDEYKKFDVLMEVKPYDYASEGLLVKCLPKILYKGNTILVTFIQLIDLRCIMLFKNIDRLKRFKWVSWY